MGEFANAGVQSVNGVLSGEIPEKWRRNATRGDDRNCLSYRATKASARQKSRQGTGRRSVDQWGW